MNTSKKTKKNALILFSFFRRRKGSEGLSQIFSHLNLNPEQYQYTTKRNKGGSGMILS